MAPKTVMITCPICEGPYKNPKYLSCLHTFCESCLERYIVNIANVCKHLDKLPVSILDTKPYIWTGDSFPCPVCRAHVQVTNARASSANPSQWASFFPVNHLVLSIMGAKSLPEEKEVCDPCKKIDDPKEAAEWCVECSEPLCSTCAKHHNVLKATIHHTVIKLADLKGRRGHHQHEEVTRCQMHGGKMMETYCVDHNKIACAECITTEHTGCDNIITIDKVAGEIRNSTETHKLLAKLKECTDETECIVLDRKRNIDKLTANKEDVLRKVKIVRADITKVLDELENILTEDLKVTHSNTVNGLDDQIARCLFLQKAIDSSRGILGAAIEYGTDNELFVVAHRMEKELHKYENVLEKEANNLMEHDYEFQPNYEIEHILLALDELGSLKVRRTPTNVSPFVKKHAQLVAKFDATSQMDERCAEITGGTFLPDDRLLLVDTANEKLKLFTSGGDLISELELGSAPWDITSIPGGMAAVTLPVEKKIMMVTGSNDCITPIEQFSTSGKCFGIAYSYYEKDLVVACDTPGDGKATVKVCSLAGKEIRDILNDENGKSVMSRPGYVATNPFNADVYVSDECNNTIIGITMKGDFRFRHNESYLNLPVGIAADNHGCVYVCGNGSCDIHQFSRDGQRVRLLMDGLTHPRAIAFDPYAERFLVTSDGSYKSTVQMFTLS